MKNNNTISSIKASELVEDFDFYPREKVDSQHVSYIAEAISSGAEMPPVIVDEKSKRIIDGFHRRRAFIRVGKNADPEDSDPWIPVELRQYKNDAEMFLDAVRLNAKHGRNLTQMDRTGAIIKAKRFGINQDAIAVVLNIRVNKVKELKTHIATIQNTRIVVPLKLPVRHFAGQTITQSQADVMPHVGGSHHLRLVNELIDAVSVGLIDTRNGQLMERLRELADVIRKFLK